MQERIWNKNVHYQYWDIMYLFYVLSLGPFANIGYEEICPFKSCTGLQICNNICLNIVLIQSFVNKICCDYFDI